MDGGFTFRGSKKKGVYVRREYHNTRTCKNWSKNINMSFTYRKDEINVFVFFIHDTNGQFFLYEVLQVLSLQYSTLLQQKQFKNLGISGCKTTLRDRAKVWIVVSKKCEPVHRCRMIKWGHGKFHWRIWSVVSYTTKGRDELIYLSLFSWHKWLYFWMKSAGSHSITFSTPIIVFPCRNPRIHNSH